MTELRPLLQATLILTRETDGQRLEGALITADGHNRPFRGWIELASAIEDWRHEHGATTPFNTQRKAST